MTTQPYAKCDRCSMPATWQAVREIGFLEVVVVMRLCRKHTQAALSLAEGKE